MRLYRNAFIFNAFIELLFTLDSFVYIFLNNWTK